MVTDTPSISTHLLGAIALAGLLILGAGCQPEVELPEALQPIDPEATAETRALYARLHQLEGVMFGHQDDLAYGVTWKDEPGRSDVKEVAGAYPAVYGWDVGDLGNEGATENLDGVNFEKMKGWIKEGYERGGVITISWHMDNLATGGGSWDTTRVVADMLPGGAHHDAYRRVLDRFARFAGDLQTDGFLGLWGGERVPLIFRPYHEMSGGWFWWGTGNAEPEDYKQLWRFTVDYLREEKDLHHVLYAYSTDTITWMDDPSAYYRFYPGDDYVDILGFDDYHTLSDSGGVARMAENLRWLAQEANSRDKVAAFTETGLEGIPDATWWTEKVLPALKADSLTREIAYIHVWRNANEADMEGHFYAPYPGQVSAEDFRRFKQDPLILFEDELPPMYEVPPQFE